MRPRGFSLLEVMVALTIVAMVFTVAFRGISVSLDTLTRIEQSNQRLEQARFKLAELDLCDPIRAGDHASGAFEDGARWTVDTSNFIPPTENNPTSMVRITLAIEWNGRNGPQRREITTYRFMPNPGNQLIPSLEEQLREIR
jgi:prepilin-type N-terminal cleavage/methylation domain-containing protein